MNLKIKIVLFVVIFISSLSIISCGVNNGDAVTSSASGPVPTVSADCSGNSCM